ncbi:hypothetical protein GJ698_09740 [Pseudoduganella sp. FT26W]|uniref:Uncharacterized protein n=1 Tax=Duganella aquatilis TaxID=2666082 RepID=A0A844CUB4_9BURK|nr:hypothetical protein [Duganella aquatilis]MRW84367.1 hypothetical protein [Duganella aquatilis]
MEFAFTLRYRLARHDCDYDALAGRLAASDCADAVVGVGRNGYLALSFLRQAGSAEAALSGAIADVERAVPTAELIDIRSDFMPN